MLIEPGYRTEQPSNHLRFMRGKLQQLWLVREVQGSTETTYSQWRDVVDATPPQEDNA